jgi:hypothetical protein
MEIENFRFDPKENIDIMIDLLTIKFRARMNWFLKISTVKKIIEIRFMKEYGICPIFNKLSDKMYCRTMKLETFEGETLKGYVLERRFILKKVNNGNGSLDVSIEDCRSIRQLKKKICKSYDLGKDLIIVDAERRVLDKDLILQMYLEELWICLNDQGSLINISRPKIEYDIILN